VLDKTSGPLRDRAVRVGKSLAVFGLRSEAEEVPTANDSAYETG